LSKIERFVKILTFGRKIQLLVKNRTFGQKMKIFVKNRTFLQKMNFWTKQLGKNHFGEKSRFLKIKNLERSRVEK